MVSLFDITLPLCEQTPVWPGDGGVRIWRTDEICSTSDFNISRMEMGVHSGTHIDAPFHLIREGGFVDTYPLNQLCGRVVVIEIDASAKIINREVLETITLNGISRVLIKTQNSKFWDADEPAFSEKYTALSSDGAEYLTSLNVCLVGIDYFSISPIDDLLEPHRILLRKNIAILENVDLREVLPGEYILYCLPMKLTGTDGAPVRAILQGD